MTGEKVDDECCCCDVWLWEEEELVVVDEEGTVVETPEAAILVDREEGRPNEQQCSAGGVR